ncbi:alcohol dehydrogenase catalytic domain-containing protein [Nocardioides sp. NPDC057772]|uniref:alcohol dehydrogenase catalytic domain-containing protein n=1 Tax=Nocardioides sp. NPDC057772 TaxID=3346245 RepID=UPI00367186DE
MCRTDLHVVDGDLPPHRVPVVPGHQVVGRVLARFDHDNGPRVGTRVGVPWLRSTCGRCRWCRAGAENLCEQSRYTGAVPSLDSAIVFAPAGEVVREALADLGPAGTCAVAGIHAEVTPYAMAEADRALADLAEDRVRGVAVLDMTR